MLPYLQLLRLPNVFTAFADIALAGFAAGYLETQPIKFVLLLIASGCLYCGGMVWNDLFDRDEDAKSRPNRPLPSGRVKVKTAFLIAFTLTILGILAAAAACDFSLEMSFQNSFFVSILLALLILAYDHTLKHTPLGPVAMGGCRSLNILLGLTGGTLADPAAIHLASITGIYILGVTLFARTEQGVSVRRTLLLACLVMLASLVLALLLPRHIASPHWLYPYLLVAFGFILGVKLDAAVRRPGPKEVQAAVKRCILGLVLLDAILAFLFASWPGLLIALLLIPARALGKRVYST